MSKLELYEYVVLSKQGHYPLVIQKLERGYYMCSPQGSSMDFKRLDLPDEFVESQIAEYRDDTINSI